MDKIYEQALLYDFYGELLTAHQRKIYEDAVFNDLSLSEIAEQYGISRQGVHDLVKRCDAALQEYERKLHMVERFTGMQGDIRRILQLSRQEGPVDSEVMQEINGLAQRLLSEL